MKEIASIDTIPVECVLMIYRELSLKAILRMGVTSRKFYAITTTLPEWRHLMRLWYPCEYDLIYKRFPQNHTFYEIFLFHVQADHVGKLNRRAFANWKDAAECIANTCSFLLCLKIIGLPKWPVQEISNVSLHLMINRYV